MKIETALLIIISLTACKGGKVASCEYKLDGITVCKGSMSWNYCKSEYDGEPTLSNTSEDPTCDDLGYPYNCDGGMHTSSQEECEKLDG